MILHKYSSTNVEKEVIFTATLHLDNKPLCLIIENQSEEESITINPYGDKQQLGDFYKNDTILNNIIRHLTKYKPYLFKNSDYHYKWDYTLEGIIKALKYKEAHIKQSKKGITYIKDGKVFTDTWNNLSLHNLIKKNGSVASNVIQKKYNTLKAKGYTIMYLEYLLEIGIIL